MTNKTLLTLTEETKASLIAGIESGSAIIVNVVNVEGGQAEIQIGSFLTGTAEERKEDPRQRALSFFTMALTEMMNQVVDMGASGAAVSKVIRSEPKLARIFDPELPEEMLKIFDNAESYQDAMKAYSELNPDMACDCPACKAEREEEAKNAGEESKEPETTEAAEENKASIH